MYEFKAEKENQIYKDLKMFNNGSITFAKLHKHFFKIYYYSGTFNPTFEYVEMGHVSAPDFETVKSYTENLRFTELDGNTNDIKDPTTVVKPFSSESSAGIPKVAQHILNLAPIQVIHTL